MTTATALLAVTITAHPLANADILEPSVQNEVDHALARAPTNSPTPTAKWHPATNGLSRTAIALRLVSTQRADGRWLDGTNDVTAAVIPVLNDLSNPPDDSQDESRRLPRSRSPTLDDTPENSHP